MANTSGRKFFKTFLVVNLIGILACAGLLALHFGLTAYLQRERSERASITTESSVNDNEASDNTIVEEPYRGHASPFEAIFAALAVLQFILLIIVDVIWILINIIRRLIRLFTAERI